MNLATNGVTVTELKLDINLTWRRCNHKRKIAHSINSDEKGSRNIQPFVFLATLLGLLGITQKKNWTELSGWEQALESDAWVQILALHHPKLEKLLILFVTQYALL